MSIGRSEFDRLLREALDRSELALRVKRLEAQLGGLAFVWGNVNSGGTIAAQAGRGFSVNKTGTGLYVITFTTAFKSTPFWEVSPITAADRAGSIDSGATVDASTARVFIVDTSAGTLADTAFFFTAAGAI